MENCCCLNLPTNFDLELSDICFGWLYLLRLQISFKECEIFFLPQDEMKNILNDFFNEENESLK